MYLAFSEQCFVRSEWTFGLYQRKIFSFYTAKSRQTEGCVTILASRILSVNPEFNAVVFISAFLKLPSLSKD